MLLDVRWLSFLLKRRRHGFHHMEAITARAA